MESRNEYYYRKCFEIYFSKDKELSKIRLELQFLRRTVISDFLNEKLNKKDYVEIRNFITELIEKTIENEIKIINN